VKTINGISAHRAGERENMDDRIRFLLHHIEQARAIAREVGAEVRASLHVDATVTPLSEAFTGIALSGEVRSELSDRIDHFRYGFIGDPYVPIYVIDRKEPKTAA
jgi:hypothetical protein